MNTLPALGTDSAGPPGTRKILVTGSTGVVGRRVVSELRRRGVGDRVIEFSGDVSSREAVRDFVACSGPIGACIHLAAVVPIAAADADPVRTFEVNALGTGCIIDEIGRQSDTPYVLLCSSSHVYAPSIYPLHENAPVQPISTYGRSKLAAEMLATDVATLRNIKFGIARVFSLWAEDQQGSFLYPSLMARFSAAQAGESVRVIGGNSIRDFLHADEVARLIVDLLAREVTGIVNVASGRPTSVLDFALARAPDGVLVNSDDVADPTSIVADTTRLRECLRG